LQIALGIKLKSATLVHMRVVSEPRPVLVTEACRILSNRRICRLFLVAGEDALLQKAWPVAICSELIVAVKVSVPDALLNGIWNVLEVADFHDSPHLHAVSEA